MSPLKIIISNSSQPKKYVAGNVLISNRYLGQYSYVDEATV